MNRPKPIAAFDLDGTLFKTSMLDAVFGVAVAESLIPPDVAQRIEEANYPWKHQINTEEIYQDSVWMTVRALMSAMTGATPDDLHELALKAARLPLRRRRFVREVMEILGESHEIVVISASFIDITKTFLEQMQVDVPNDLIFGSSWEITNGRYTGEGETIDKVAAVEQLRKSGRIILENSCAFGDTISDLGMLEVVEVGFMVNPSGALEAVGSKLHTIRESKNTITYIAPHEGPEGRSLSLQTTEQILERTGLLK